MGQSLLTDPEGTASSPAQIEEPIRFLPAELAGTGQDCPFVAVIHPATLAIGAEAFYRYFTETLELTDFQVNTPFFGGPAKELAGNLQLDLDQLSRFLTELFDHWIEHSYAAGVSLGPFDALINHFIGRPARLPCIWKENCSNQFVSINSKALSHNATAGLPGRN